MNWRRWLCLGLILMFGTLLRARAPALGAPFITNYGPEQYKAGSQSWVTVQDRRGVMYFGNTMGILEFDGQHWQLIPTSATVRALTSGPGGTIYFGSVGDLGYLAASPTGKISAVSLREAIPTAKRDFNDVWQVESAADGVYFLTRSKIFRFHDGRITVLPGKLASSQACVLDGTLFYADMEKGICLVDGNRVVPVPQLADVYNGKRITMTPFGRHELLMGRITGDFRRIDLSELWDETSQRYDTHRPASNDMVHIFPTELDALLNENKAYMYKLLHIGPDSFAIGTVKAGILTFDRSGRFIRAIDKAEGLLDNTVTSIFLDRSGDLWATNNAGISHIELSVPQSMFGTGSGIDGICISACFHKGRLYVGTFQSLLVQAPYRFTLKDAVHKFRVVEDSPTEIWQLLEVEGDLLAASGSGVFQIRGDSAFKIPGSSPSNLCLGVSRMWPDYLFVGRLDGLEVFNRTSDHWNLVGRMDGIKENIRGITEDANGDLWLNTDARGMLRAHFSGSKPTKVVVHRFGPEHGLPGLTRLRSYSYGQTLYVCSPKGLFFANILPSDTESPDEINFAPDLALGKAFSNPPEAINDMVSDGKGGFLFSTSDGIVLAFPGKDGRFQMTDRPFKGLASPDDALYVHPDGCVWLLGRALHRVNIRAPKDYEQGFEVLIRKVVDKTGRTLFEGTYGREGVGVQSSRTVFCSTQKSEDVPVLPYSHNALSFEFSASFYEKPGTTQFQYLLEGFDKDWSKWQSGAFKEYTNIPEGNYRFRVRARNIYGTIGHEAVYSLRILPPWYRTIWAYILLILGCSSVLAGAYTLRVSRLKKRQTELIHLVDDRTRELRDNQKKLLVSEKMASLGRLTAGIAHEMNTPLAAVRASHAELKKLIAEYESSVASTEVTPSDHLEIAREMQDSLQLADRAAKKAAGFVRGIKSQTRDMEVKEQLLFDSVPVIEDAISLLNHALKSRNCTVHFDHPERAEIKGSPARLAQVVTNLVLNAIEASAAKGGGRIEIRLEQKQDRTDMWIRDQGCGISEETLSSIFDPMFTTKPFGEGTGLGLSIAHDIVVGEYGGTISVSSENQEGATFWVSIPGSKKSEE